MKIKKDIVKATDELARIVKEKNLSFIRVKDGEVEIEVGGYEPQIVHAAVPGVAPFQQVSQAPEIPAASAPVTASAVVSGNFVKSPIVGTFYAAAAEGKPPFVQVGDKVEKGKVVCIIESMKLMNEIVSEHSGTVAEIYVANAEAVEFDQKLMRIE
ncbi:MAG: acetyl-CoA carboxylase biotin carboxyl carrier protein [Oscillospiraceae bacterium]|nr:acetyl-CoA carboxylase biotin carboxyl carrier protein [Oscillospiraceae bacterium]